MIKIIAATALLLTAEQLSAQNKKDGVMDKINGFLEDKLSNGQN